MRKIVILSSLVAALLFAGCTAEPAPDAPIGPATRPAVLAGPTLKPVDSPVSEGAATPKRDSQQISPSGSASPLPSPSPTAPVTNTTLQELPESASVSAIREPLLIDGERGRIYASAQVNARPATVGLSTADGRLLALFDAAGRLALDRRHGLLVVDQGPAGLLVLDAGSGAALANVSLPPADGDNAPDPQIDPATGLVYAFRDATLYVVDPEGAEIVETVVFDVPRSVCSQPAGTASVWRSDFDLVSRTLYLGFISASCIPWSAATVVAYKPESGEEVGQTVTEVQYQAVPFLNSLFGTTAFRMGPVSSWAWNGQDLWFEETLMGEGLPGGIVADWGRQLVYEALGERIRVLDPSSHAVVAERSVEGLAGKGRLAGHDPISDNLYFLTGAGRLKLWPAENLFEAGEPPRPAAEVLPEAPVRVLSLASSWPTDRTMAGLWENGDCPVDGGRLFMRRDGSDDWRPLPVAGDGSCDALVDLALSPAFAADGTLFVAADDQNTVLKSTDGGHSWQPTVGSFPVGTRFRRLVISPGFPRDLTVLAHTVAGELYRSRDGGQGWQRLGPILDQVAVSPEYDQDQVLMGSYAGELFISRDGGDEWQRVGSTPNSESLTMLALAPQFAKWQTVFAFSNGGELHRSRDGGITWEYLLGTSPGSGTRIDFAPDVEENRPVFLLHQGELLASFDGWDSTWSWAPSVRLPPGSVTAMVMSPNYVDDASLYVGTVDGQVIALDARRPVFD